MGSYNFTLKNLSTGNVTEIKSTTIKTIVGIISNLKRKENENAQIPIELMRSGKRIKPSNEVYSKEINNSVMKEITKDILKNI